MKFSPPWSCFTSYVILVCASVFACGVQGAESAASEKPFEPVVGQAGRAEGDCGSWCSWLLFIVPAQAAGRWRLQKGELELEQKFQMLSGTYTVDGVSATVEKGRLLGEQITFTVGGTEYNGKVSEDAMVGAGWNATRLR